MPFYCLPAVASEGTLQLESRRDSASGRVLVSDRSAEQRHDAIAKEVRDRPLIAVHGLDHQLHRPLEDVVDVFLVDSLRQSRGVDSVGEQDGDRPSLTLQFVVAPRNISREASRNVKGGLRTHGGVNASVAVLTRTSTRDSGFI